MREVCWNIWRFNSDHPNIKAYGTNCPCDYDPQNNQRCPAYEAVIINEIPKISK